MTWLLRRFAITLIFLGFVSILPATAGAQPPAYLTQWGSYGSGDGQFYFPACVAADAAGNIYVADSFNHRIQKFTGTGTYLTQWGSPGSGEGQFFYPVGVATDGAGNVFVVDNGNSRIQKFTSSGTYITQWGSQGSSDGQFSYPVGVATDLAGNVYVSDGENSRVEKFTGSGSYITQWGIFGSGDGQFYFPSGVATDAASNVYVVDNGNSRIQKFTSAGTYVIQWGTLGSGDGQFNGPTGIGTDATGNVYVTEFSNYRIQKFTATGAYLAQWGSQGSGNGEFNDPRGVAADAAGHLYVADAGNHRIQKFGSTPTPTITMPFDLSPSTLNASSHGLLVTGFLEPASPFAASDIDISSIRLNGTVPVDPAAPTALGDHDGNGVPDLMVKFNRAAVELTVSQGDSVPVTAAGTVDGHSFSGTDYIRVRRPAAALRIDSQRETDAVAQARAAFSIDDQVGIGDGGAQFELRGATPNPAQQALWVSFSLRGSRLATLALFDVSGRQLAARRVDGMGAGSHTVALGGQNDLPTGLYVIRLTEDGWSLTTRAVVVR